MNKFRITSVLILLVMIFGFASVSPAAATPVPGPDAFGYQGTSIAELTLAERVSPARST